MIYVIILVICMLFPEITMAGVKESVGLWFNSILPVLFPFFVISNMLYHNGGATVFEKIFKPITKLLGLDGNVALPLALSIFCGFPTGSKIVGEMEKDGLKNIDYYANICYSSSPLFIIGTVGITILKDKAEGFALLIIHMCALIIFSVIFGIKHKCNDNVKMVYSSCTVGSAIKDSISSILNVCAYMAVFGVIIKYITVFMPEKFSAVISGIFEFTTGIKKLSNNTEAMPLISFYLSFGGICVIMQCFSHLKNINKVKFILNRFFTGIIAFILCLIYKKTAIYTAVLITTVIVVAGLFIRKYHLLKSSRS